jgi:hypothetical protein
MEVDVVYAFAQYLKALELDFADTWWIREQIPAVVQKQPTQ